MARPRQLLRCMPPVFDGTEEGWLRAVWESASEAIALSDEAGMVLHANPAYFALYGFSPEEVVGQRFAVIFPQDQRASAEADYRAIFDSASPPPVFQSNVVRRDGAERTGESRISFLEQSGRRVAMLSMIRDVTDTVTALQALQRAEAERVGFLSSLAHDVKSPLAAIKGQAQLLRRRLERRSSTSVESLVGTLLQGGAGARRGAGRAGERGGAARGAGGV